MIYKLAKLFSNYKVIREYLLGRYYISEHKLGNFITKRRLILKAQNISWNLQMIRITLCIGLKNIQGVTENSGNGPTNIPSRKKIL